MARNAGVRQVVTLGALVAAFAWAEPAGGVEPPARPKMSAFYVGNWLLDNSMPPFHDELGQSAGREWSVGVRSDLGLMLYMDLYSFAKDWAYGDTDVWTTAGRGKLKKVFEERPWDALVVQPSGWIGLHRGGEQMGPWYREQMSDDLKTDDFGDVASASALFRFFLERHPGGELIVFEGLPELETETGPDGALVMQDTAAGPEPAPDREGFDYVRHWETVRYDPAQGEGGRTSGTRDYTRQLMEGLKACFPEKWNDGNLCCIPVGEVYNVIEKRIRAGKFPAPDGVTSFYSDTVHQRTGLPRYVIAATMYAVLFQDRPHALDWSLYNDSDAYGQLGGPNWFYAHVPDFGEHLPITAELAEAANDVIWDVVTGHPYAGVGTASE